MTKPPRIVITPGEPAGVGPDILLQILQQEWPAELIAVCDPALLSNRAHQLGLPFEPILIENNNPPQPHVPGTLKIIPVKMAESCEPGKLNLTNAHYVIECLNVATQYCLNYGAALTTGPIQKSLIEEAGIPFRGHTEYLANRCGVTQSIMLFVANDMKVALATTHIPLSHVPNAITQSSLLNTLRLLNLELKKKFHIDNPNILVCGLNPHAGEQGHLGREEIEIIEPVIKQLQSENLSVVGPLPADTIFTKKYLTHCDAILAMYHDQALPTIKYLGFGQAVNVTLGLPIVRTSVDHGTALDVAGTLNADPGSLLTAIHLAIEMVSSL